MNLETGQLTRQIKVIIVSGLSAYHALSVFAGELKKGFCKLGTECVLVDYSLYHQDIEKFHSDIAAEMGQGMGIVISMNAVDMDFLNQIVENTQFITAVFCVDHPFYHESRLFDLKSGGFFVERTFTAFAEKYYSSLTFMETVRQAGILSEKENIPFSFRKNRVCFFGTYFDLSNMMEEIKKSDLEQVVSFMIDAGINHPEKKVEELLEEVNSICNLDMSDREFVKNMAGLSIVEKFLRAFFRIKMVKMLIENDVEVDIYGAGWENLVSKGKEHLHCYPAVGYREMADIMTEYRFALNVLPWAKDGFHDRIATAMLNGCVCISDTSIYLEEEQLDGKALFLYTLGEERKAVERFLYYYNGNGEKDAEMVSVRAQKYACEHHLWIHRAEQILQYVSLKCS